MNDVSIYGAYSAADDFKDMRQEDIILPRLGLMQFGSKPVKERKANAGDFINTGTGDIMIPADKPQLVVPLVYWLEWIEWNPNRKEDKRILNRSIDPNSDLARMSMQRVQIKNSEGKTVYRVNEAYTFTMLMPEHFGNYEDMVVYSFQKTGHSVGKQWLNRMRALKNNGTPVPMAGAAWQLGNKLMSKEGDDWMAPTIGEGSLLDTQTALHCLELAAKCKQRRDEMQEASLKSHEEAADAENADKANGGGSSSSSSRPGEKAPF